MQFSQHHILKRPSLLHCIFLPSLSKIRCPVVCGFQFSSVTQLCLTPCEPMDCNISGLPVHYQLLEFTQTHVHWVGDAIQPSHPLSSPSSATFSHSQHQGLFKWVSFFASGGQCIRVSASESVIPMNIQDWFPLGWQERRKGKIYPFKWRIPKNSKER